MGRRLFGLASVVVGVGALVDGLARTPPMGWRSWNCYHGGVTDAAIRATIDAITSRHRRVDGEWASLADLGYARVGIDDGWQLCHAGRDGASALLPTLHRTGRIPIALHEIPSLA